MKRTSQRGPDLFATPDLFGDLPAGPTAALRSPARPKRDDLDGTAELLALRSGRPKSQERAEIARTIAEATPAPDDFEDEDGPDYIDEGADTDAAWDAEALAAEAAGDPTAVPETAPVCDECKISATIHEWASPHGREGFPCPPGSFERDRATYEASIYVGQRTERDGQTWEITQHTYTRKTEDRPAWFTRDVLSATLARYRSANCYGAHWVERRVVAVDLFTQSTGSSPMIYSLACPADPKPERRPHDALSRDVARRGRKGSSRRFPRRAWLINVRNTDARRGVLRGPPGRRERGRTFIEGGHRDRRRGPHRRL